jgi:adenylate kinase
LIDPVQDAVAVAVGERVEVVAGIHAVGDTVVVAVGQRIEVIASILAVRDTVVVAVGQRIGRIAHRRNLRRYRLDTTKDASTAAAKSTRNFFNMLPPFMVNSR